LESGFVQPLGELDNEITASRAGGVVGRHGRLFGQIQRHVDVPEAFLFLSDLRIRHEEAHEFQDPGGIVDSTAGHDLVSELLPDGRGTQTLIQEIQLVQDQEVESERKAVDVLEAALGARINKQSLVGLNQAGQLLPGSGEQGRALLDEDGWEDGAYLDEGL